MAKQLQIILTAVVLSLALSSCAGGAFGGFPPQSLPIDEADVTRTVRYFDEGSLGPVYEISFTVPDAWVDSFETEQTGSIIAFNFVTPEGRRARLFTIEALSQQQFWEQNGSYPTQFTNILNTWDTYFIYNVPLDAFYSGLSDELYDELTAAIPGVIESFVAEEVEDGAIMTMLLPGSSPA